MTNRFRNQLMMSTLLAGVASIAAPVAAQTVQQTEAQTTAPQSDTAADAKLAQATPADNAAPSTTNDIVVTGTLIRNPNLVASSPVNTIGEGEILLRQPNTPSDLLSGIPGVTPGIGTAVNNGATGVNTIDLRGLGPQRNIVLLDGNRLVPSRSDGVVDLNVIPLALIQRVDVLTGGASTTYGADAVSGVVNFITRRDFTGIDARADYKIPERGEGRSYRADLTIGANFADDKGNAVLSLGYTSIDPVYQTRGFALYGISPINGKASGSSPTSTPTSIAFNTGSNVQVDPTSTALVPQYQNFNFNPYNIFQTPLERKSAYGAARYDVADGVEVYARGLFSNNTIKSIIAPSGIFGLGENINANNPYLPAGIRNTVCARDLASDLSAAADALSTANGHTPDPVTAAAYTADSTRYSAANCGLQTGSSPFVAPTVVGGQGVAGTGSAGNSLLLPGVYRRTVEVGPRISTFENNIYDARAGVRVDITKSINLDVNASYGRSEQTQTQSGYVINSLVQQALIATNTTTCTNNTGGCVPLNIFGPSGSISAAQVAFIQGASTIRINTELKQARAVLSGDFGTTIPYASNPISFALGGEYRQYTYERLPDAFAQSPTQLGGAGGAVLPFAGGYDVKEAFGELNLPIANGQHLFDELTAEAGVRYSSYNINAAGASGFNTTTYKGGLTWQPVQGVRLRGNYQRAVRAPNIGELFAPVVTGLTSLNTDPCAGAAPVGNANLAAICLAQGAKGSQFTQINGDNTTGIPQPSAGQPNFTGGGNINIKPEVANTWTVGVVLTPSQFIPGLTLSVDYNHIIINRAITAETPADAIAACFNNITAASATAPACTAIRRNPVTGALSGPSSTTLGLALPETNNGRLATDGVDVTANYNHHFGDVGVNLNFAGNWTNHLYFAASSTSVNRDCVGYYSVNCAPANGQIVPRYTFQQRSTLSLGGASLSLLWRFLSPVSYEGTASDYIARGFTAGNRFLYSGVITNSGVGVLSTEAGKNLNFNHIPAYHYFDGSAQFNIGPKYQLTMTVTNIFDRDPPDVGSPGTGTTSANSGNTFPSTYDVLGRTYSVGIRLKF